MTDAVRAALEKAERAIDTFMDEEKRADILFRQRTADIAVDALVDIQKARAALANDGWRDMESAPRDGTPILLFARCKTATAPAINIGWYIDGMGWIEAAFVPNEPVGLVPSYWQPLPNFPVSKEPAS